MPVTNFKLPVTTFFRIDRELSDLPVTFLEKMTVKFLSLPVTILVLTMNYFLKNLARDPKKVSLNTKKVPVILESTCEQFQE